MICLDETYCRRGIPMLKTRIQLPALAGGQPAAWMLSLSQLTEQYAEQTLLPAICHAYDSLPTVAEKMHFELYGYRHRWQTASHPRSPTLLTVHMETVLSHGDQIVCRNEFIFTIDGESGMIVKDRKRGHLHRSVPFEKI